MLAGQIATADLGVAARERLTRCRPGFGQEKRFRGRGGGRMGEGGPSSALACLRRPRRRLSSAGQGRYGGLGRRLGPLVVRVEPPLPVTRAARPLLDRLNISSIFGDRRYGISLPSTRTLKQEWFSNVRADLLAGVVVALALIPEAIAFSIIAGVDPKVGLYASFCIAVTTAFVGGRPGMISAATGAMALVMITLVRDHGLDYLFAATLLTGAIQIAFGLFRLGRYMKFVPRSVMTGFVNALAILIFMAQLPLFVGAGWEMVRRGGGPGWR